MLWPRYRPSAHWVGSIKWVRPTLCVEVMTLYSAKTDNELLTYTPSRRRAYPSNISKAHICPKLGVVVFVVLMYCETHPLELLRTSYHGYFSPTLANLRRRRYLPPSACPPIVERTFAAGGVNVSVNHPREAG